MMKRAAAVALAMLAALAVAWSAPAAAEETPGSYRLELNRIHADMNSLTLEIENFRINQRYCKPPQIPTKAEAQAALDELAARLQALSGKYNARKQGLKDFARNSRVAAELELRGVTPTDERWWRNFEIARRRMLDALARKQAALAAAPELDCRPKPKPQPVVSVPTFQAPPVPVRPAADVSAWPALPQRFCSREEYWDFINRLNQLAERAAEGAERAAKFRTEVEQAINAYVQKDQPVPRQLYDQRRQAHSDFAAATRRLADADANVRRAKAIPIVDCRPPQQAEPPRTSLPAQAATPGEKFQSGSPLDGLRNRAWAQVEAMKAAYDRCDEAAYEQALREYDRILAEAKLARGAARGSAEFSNVTPKEAEGLVEGLESIIEPRRWLLLDLKRKCRERSRTQPPSTPSQTGFVPPPNREMAIVLDVHNRERAAVGSRPLRWDPQLAEQAATYRPQMGQGGQPVHSSRVGRETTRENLLPALPGTPAERMVGVWAGEKRNFVPGTFPNVSKTGNWYDVGHYTQMIWPTTTNVGCAILRRLASYDWLVCRYSPPGNRDGRAVLADNSGVAAPDSSTPPFPRIPKLPVGGGMQQLDPPPPPRPPAPTGRDPAPEGNEDKHPLVGYAAEAFVRHMVAIDCGDAIGAQIQLSNLYYTLEQLRERLKDARAAGPFSGVRPEDVQRQIDRVESWIRLARERRARPTCPMPAPRRP